MFGRPLLVAALLFFGLCVAAQAQTSTETAAPTPASEAAKILRSGDPEVSGQLLRDLIARLSDEEVRQLLLERFDLAVEEKRQQQFAMSGIHFKAGEVRERLVKLAHAVDDVPAEIGAAVRKFLDGRPMSTLTWVLVGCVVIVITGLIFEWLFTWATRNLRARILSANPVHPVAKCLFPFARLIINLTGVLAFLIGAVIAFFVLYEGHEDTRIVIMTYLGMICAVRAFTYGFQFILAPNTPNLRLVNFPDSDARFVYRRCLVVAWTAGLVTSTTGLLGYFGISEEVRFLLSLGAGIIICAAMINALLGAKKSISADIRGNADIGRVRGAIADAWPYVTSICVILILISAIVLFMVGLQLPYTVGLGTLGILIVLPHLDSAIDRTARFRADGGTDEYQLVIFKALRIFVNVFALFLLVQLWGVNIGEVARQSVGGRVAGALLDIGATALIAYILWQMARIWIDRALAKDREESGVVDGDGDEGGQGGTRLSTLLPLIRTSLQITIAVIATLVILSGIGVDIGPLLAGAGVVGLAIGFGAQALVRDIVSGVFFLIDDAFRVGEYIDVGDVKGSVEKISIRSLRLRHHRGLLHTIPFGEIRHLTNFSRDWVIMKMEFRLTYDTDVNKVKKLFKVIGAEMLEHPTLGEGFIEPFKSQGVKRMEDSAMILGSKFKAKPGQQFMIRKEIYNRVQKAFAENDIHFAHRRVAIDLPDGIDPESEQGKALGNAAAAAIAAEEEQQTTGAGPKTAAQAS